MHGVSSSPTAPWECGRCGERFRWPEDARFHYELKHEPESSSVHRQDEVEVMNDGSLKVNNTVSEPSLVEVEVTEVQESADQSGTQPSLPPEDKPPPKSTMASRRAFFKKRRTCGDCQTTFQSRGGYVSHLGSANKCFKLRISARKAVLFIFVLSHVENINLMKIFIILSG